jgi:DNA polymerase III sliding clamp (beta) subunit (PCNA family)
MKTFAVIFESDIDVLATADDDEGTLVVEAGRGGVYLKQTLEANIQVEGEVVLSCAHFTQLRFGKEATLEMKLDNNRLSFKAGRLKGKVVCSPGIDDIESQRPLKEFDAEIALPAEVFKNSVSRATFTSAIPNATHGVRIQAGEELKISTTDHYRATLYREELAVGQDDIDVILKPSFVQTLLSRVEDIEVAIGADRGMFKLTTDSLEIYHPVIQLEPEDIEEWIKEGIDYSARKCLVTTTVEDLTRVIDEASSIAGSLGFDVRIECLVKGKKLLVRVNADHGTAQSHMKLQGSDAKEKHLTKLSSRYLLEMLRLVKAGDLNVGFWDDFVMLQANADKFTALIPTIAV